MSESILLAVTADVMFYDGSQWIRPDIANGLHNNITDSSHLSNIQLVRSSSDLTFRIMAIRNRDSKRLVNQPVFQRLKYKEATPSFHQWRNENKQVIGLNFTNEHDAKRFYMAVKQVLDNAVNTQQQIAKPIHQPEITYQDPQNYQSTNGSQEMYMTHINQQQSADDTMKLNNYTNSNRITCRNANAQVQNSIQQQGLLRRASQGSNISSSTGGSAQGQIYAPVSISTQNGNNLAHQNNGDIANYECCNTILPQQAVNNSGAGTHLMLPQTSNGSMAQQLKPTQTGNAPPPPPPPPPDLKSLIAGRQPPSFADQLKHVQLRKSSTGSGQQPQTKANISPSNSAGSSNGSAGLPAVGKFQSGNQDLINELSDRLNKRKLTVEASTSGNNAPQHRPPVYSTLAPNNLKTAANSIVALHRKVPSGSSLSSQDDPNNGGIGGGGTVTTAAGSEVAGNSRQTPIAPNSETGGVKAATFSDLEKVKIELMEEFARELSKAKQEITQTIREEIAKLASASR